MALDIGHMMGGGFLTGDSSGWAGGVAQATVPVTNLAPHVDGGTHSALSGTNAGAPPEAHRTLRFAVGIVVAALLLLWMSGSLLFRSSIL